MTVLSFNSHESMLEYLRRASDEAFERMHPVQAALTFGDYWVQFADLGDNLIVFGRIHTLDEVREGEDENVEEVLATTVSDLSNGYMYGMAHDRYNPAGELGMTHKSVVWPIEERLFLAAEKVGFNYPELDLDMQILLSITHIAYKTHNQVVDG